MLTHIFVSICVYAVRHKGSYIFVSFTVLSVFLCVCAGFHSLIVMFFFWRYGDHRELHRVDRRQRQMCIRDRRWTTCRRNSRNSTKFCPTTISVTSRYSSRARIRGPSSSCFQWCRFTNCTVCPLYTSPSPRDRTRSRMPSSAWTKKWLVYHSPVPSLSAPLSLL